MNKLKKAYSTQGCMLGGVCVSPFQLCCSAELGLRNGGKSWRIRKAVSMQLQNCYIE